MRIRALLLAATLVLAAGPGGGAAAANPPRVTVLADSVGGVLYWDAPARDLLGRRIDLRIEQATCRKLVEPGCEYGPEPPESALAAIQRLGADLGRIVIVNVGYNDPSDGYAHKLDEVMGALVAAGVQHVIWVTLEETEGVWAESNQQIRAAPTRWPELEVADWAPAAAGHDWFVDDAHMNSAGAAAYASFLRPLVLADCGADCAPTIVFCGLARTATGFEPVSAGDVACGQALQIVERGEMTQWSCTRATEAANVLECRKDEAVIRVLAQSPLHAVRTSGGVRMANWLFRVRGRALQAREDGGSWATIARAPFCVPSAPREVLVALRLRRLAANAACYALPKSP